MPVGEAFFPGPKDRKQCSPGTETALHAADNRLTYSQHLMPTGPVEGRLPAESVDIFVRVVGGEEEDGAGMHKSSETGLDNAGGNLSLDMTIIQTRVRQQHPQGEAYEVGFLTDHRKGAWRITNTVPKSCLPIILRVLEGEEAKIARLKKSTAFVSAVKEIFSHVCPGK